MIEHLDTIFGLLLVLEDATPLGLSQQYELFPKSLLTSRRLGLQLLLPSGDDKPHLAGGVTTSGDPNRSSVSLLNHLRQVHAPPIHKPAYTKTETWPSHRQKAIAWIPQRSLRGLGLLLFGTHLRYLRGNWGARPMALYHQPMWSTHG